MCVCVGMFECDLYVCMHTHTRMPTFCEYVCVCMCVCVCVSVHVCEYLLVCELFSFHLGDYEDRKDPQLLRHMAGITG